jgi:hypothetical protein
MMIRGVLSWILVGTLGLRLAVLYFDLYTGVPIYSSGADTEAFYAYALMFGNDPSLVLNDDLWGEIYPRCLGLLFWLIGPSRVFAQYTNVLLGLSALICVGRAMEYLSIGPSVQNRVTAVIAFLPVPIVLSAILLREAIVVFCVSLSVLALSRWMVQDKAMHVGMAFLALAIAAMFHSGSLGVMAGIVAAVILYNRELGRFTVSVKRIFRLAPVLGGLGLVLVKFPDLFVKKFGGIEGIDDVYAVAEVSRGGSAYLSGVTVESFGDLIVIAPLKAFYLVFSPMPMDWRGVSDVVMFLVDSVFFIATAVAIVKLRTLSRGRMKAAAVAAALAIVGAALVFGLGTGAAGTAVRHRDKLVPLCAVCLASWAQNRQDQRMFSVRPII